MLELEIKTIIEKNLPSQVGDVLKQRLEQADKDAEALKYLKEDSVRLNNSISSLNTQIELYRKNDERNAKLDSREREIEQRERNAKVAELEFKLTAEQEKTQFSKEVALGLVRNTEYKRTVFDSKHGPGGFDQYGNQIYATHSTSAEENKTAE